MITSFFYRFADANHAAAMIADLMGTVEEPSSVRQAYSVKDWGPLITNTGTPEEPSQTVGKGHLVELISWSDGVPIDQWDQWLYAPDAPPHQFAGMAEAQAIGLEWASPIDEDAAIDTTVPSKRELNEKIEAERQAKVEAMAALIVLRLERDKKAAEKADAIEVDALNAEIIIARAAKEKAFAAILAAQSGKR